MGVKLILFADIKLHHRDVFHNRQTVYGGAALVSG